MARERDIQGISEGAGLTRRHLLTRSAATAAVVGTGGFTGLLATDAGAAHPGPPANIPPPPIPLFTDSILTFQCSFALGATSAFAAEYGEVATVVKAIKDRGEAYFAYYDEFNKAGKKAARLGGNAAKRGDRVTAKHAYLRSATYFAQALYFVLATARPTRAHERAVYRRMTVAWQRAGRLMNPAMEVVRLPWRGPNGPMPGWFLKPARGGKRRPTIIMNNGSDAQAIDLWSAGGLAALQRGWNVLIFDGPGQGGMLFEKNQHFVPDWERVVTPIVNWLHKRKDVDRERIVISGSSFGGGLVPRAMAFEHRLAAFSCDPGVVSSAETWTSVLPPAFLEQHAQGKRAELNAEWNDYLSSESADVRFNIAKRLEIYPGKDFFDQLTAILKYNNTKVMKKVRTPGLILNNEIEQFFPGQPRELFKLLKNSPKKGYRTFTIAEGAQYHCEPMAPTLRNGYVMDWFDRIVDR